VSRVLLIDDEPGMAGLVSMCIEKAEVTRVGNLRQAVDAARERPPDLVLLDLALGSEDGLDILPDLRAEPVLSKVPIVAFTVHGSREREAMALGTDAFVSKPFKPAALRAAVAPFLEGIS
jgi:DNA-binding response OmpR family regulator